jgi:hypothetical protein
MQKPQSLLNSLQQNEQIIIAKQAMIKTWLKVKLKKTQVFFLKI